MELNDIELLHKIACECELMSRVHIAQCKNTAFMINEILKTLKETNLGHNQGMKFWVEGNHDTGHYPAANLNELQTYASSLGGVIDCIIKVQTDCVSAKRYLVSVEPAVCYFDTPSAKNPLMDT